MYEPRFYRKDMGERFTSFVHRYRETDIWVAFNADKSSDLENIRSFTADKCRSLRTMFEDYFKTDPDYELSMQPYHVSDDVPVLIKELSDLSFNTGVGPMAGIAGLFSREVGISLKDEFKLKDIIVENGGDNYIDVTETLTVSLFAGKHPLSGKVILKIEPHQCPLGLCSSSGKFGHSKSLGEADLVSVACKNALLADQYATAYANRILSVDDIGTVLDSTSNIEEIMHISVFKDGAFGIRGSLNVSDR